MTNKTEKLVHALLLPINPAAVIILGIYTMLWGFWLANPLWTVFNHAQLYSVLAHTAPFHPEVFWGTIAMVCGSITVYGAVKRSYRALVRGSSIAGWHWFMISIFYFMGDAANTGGITALVFCFYAVFIYLNIRVNFKDDRKSVDLLHPTTIVIVVSEEDKKNFDL